MYLWRLLLHQFSRRLQPGHGGGVLPQRRDGHQLRRHRRSAHRFLHHRDHGLHLLHRQRDLRRFIFFSWMRTVRWIQLKFLHLDQQTRLGTQGRPRDRLAPSPLVYYGGVHGCTLQVLEHLKDP